MCRALIAAAIAGVLQACASLDPRVPDVAAPALPATWTRSDPVLPHAEAALAQWWQRFGDPILDGLVADAMRTAPDLRTAQARLRQARAARDLATANLYPSVGVSASATRSSTGTAAGGSGSARTLYAAGFDASWEPPIFGGLREAEMAAEADVAAAVGALAATRVSLIAEVAADYVALRSDQERLAIAARNVASQAETLQLTSWRLEAGLATSLDVEQARGNLETSRSSLPGLESSRTEAEHGLALLTGRAPGALAERLRGAQRPPDPPESIAVGIPADTIRQRPDVRAAESALRAEIARSAQQRAARLPSFTLGGTLSWQALRIAALGDAGTAVRSLAGNLAATLFDGGRIRSRIAVQDAVQEQALIAYEKTVLAALQDVEDALAAYAAGRERVTARSRAFEAADNASLLARTLYEAGAVDFQKVLDTDRARFSAEDALAGARADVLVAVIRLYKALGGGWSSESDER